MNNEMRAVGESKERAEEIAERRLFTGLNNAKNQWICNRQF